MWRVLKVYAIDGKVMQMDLVIKIDDEVKETFDKASKDDINGCFYDYKSCIGKAIKNGIPLPKGHGRLIDAKQFEEDNKEFWERDFIHPRYEDRLCDLVNDAPTVIEADKGVEK